MGYGYMDYSTFRMGSGIDADTERRISKKKLKKAFLNTMTSRSKGRFSKCLRRDAFFRVLRTRKTESRTRASG